jgi:hypothetical protein
MWYIDVDTGSSSATSPTWTPVLGITQFQDKIEPNLEDDSDFDSGGYMSQTKTGEQWSLEFSVSRKVTATDKTAYDKGQEFLRGKGIGKIGIANSVHVRFYEMTEDGPRVEAYEGNAAVSYSPAGGKMTDLNMVDLVLTGQGKLKQIAHPDSGSSA